VEGEPRLFLRLDPAPPDPEEHYTLRREARFYRAARQAGVPGPQVLAVHPTMEAVLLERMDGQAAFAEVDTAAQCAIIDDFAVHLARLHSAGTDALGLGSTTMRDATLDELDIWETRLDGHVDPFLTACFRWLRDHLPDTARLPAVLVQGDTGPGNFLHDGRRVTAFLDFELAHLGDPMDDLAWVGTRNAQQPVPDFERFLAHYEAAAGSEVDRQRVRYFALFAELRIAVLGTGRADDRPDNMAEHGYHLVNGALHRRLTVEALSAAAGVELPAVRLPSLTDTADTRLYDGLLAQMEAIVLPAVDDPVARRRAQSMTRVVTYLREANRAGDSHVECELADLAHLLGGRPGTVANGRAALRAQVVNGELNAVDLLPYATGDALRRQQLVLEAMGPLAGRHLPML
jgi:aminoglycoside phosphotransferase (APT) family kinase protein